MEPMYDAEIHTHFSNCREWRVKYSQGEAKIKYDSITVEDNYSHRAHTTVGISP